MKVLIQNHATKFYLGQDNHWQNNPEAALTFPTAMAAADFCKKKAITGARVVLRNGSKNLIEMPFWIWSCG